MNLLKIFVVFVLTLIFLSSTLTAIPVKSQEVEVPSFMKSWFPTFSENLEKIYLNPDLRFVEKVFLIRFAALRRFLGTPFFVLRFVELEQFVADPEVIGIEYLDRTRITIGAIDQTTGDYISLSDVQEDLDGMYPVILSNEYEFSLEVPENIPRDAFIAHFSPQSLSTNEEGDVKTDLLLTSNVPQDAILPENIYLRVNISKYTTFGNVFLPPKGRRNPIPLGGLYAWIYAAIFPPNPFGRLYSGKRVYEYSTYVDLIVRLDRYHQLEIMPTETKVIGPDQLLIIPLEVKNLGSHVDSFNFRISSDTDSKLIVSPPPALTLGPNEVAQTFIGVASPQILQDPGTARGINIEAYSIYDPTTTFNNTATVITRGIYIPEISIIYGTTIFVIILVFVGIYYIRRKKKPRHKPGKPQKPWTIPEEQQHLQTLKKQDPELYKQERKMMQQEYQSALLWYNNQKTHRKKPTTLKSMIPNTKMITDFIKPPKKPKQQPPKKTKKAVPKKKPKPKPKKKSVQKKKQPKPTPKKSDEERRKQEAIRRIKREQSKQNKNK